MDRTSGKPDLRARLYATGAHQTVVDMLADTDALAVVLAEGAHATGTHTADRDYHAEAAAVAVAVALWMRHPPKSEPELADPDVMAAFHGRPAA